MNIQKEIWVVYGPKKNGGWQDKRSIRAYTTPARAASALKASGVSPELCKIVRFVPSEDQ